GATEVFEAADNIELVASTPCDWDATIAFDTTKDLITEYPDLKGIFACNDVMALAAVEALAAENVEGVLVYGVDFTDDARAAIKDGSMTGSMSYSSVKYTEAALNMAIAMCQGAEYDSPIYLPLTLVTVDNVADMDDWK
ncbi:MAG: substrate-binding domain-containing protein, partial [Oscillospiraceae bacterium]|nr:substrate-binding domain-containing protein [Oscillospiraceae bacterium]